MKISSLIIMVPEYLSRLDELKDIIKLVVKEIKEEINTETEICDIIHISIRLTGHKNIQIDYEFENKNI